MFPRTPIFVAFVVEFVISRIPAGTFIRFTQKCICQASVCLLSADDDLSGHSSGHETPASSSSRQDLDAEEGKKKKTKGKKKDKKSKGKKKTVEESVEDAERKTKKKGFALLR